MAGACTLSAALQPAHRAGGLLKWSLRDTGQESSEGCRYARKPVQLVPQIQAKTAVRLLLRRPQVQHSLPPGWRKMLQVKNWTKGWMRTCNGCWQMCMPALAGGRASHCVLLVYGRRCRYLPQE